MLDFVFPMATNDSDCLRKNKTEKLEKNQVIWESTAKN